MMELPRYPNINLDLFPFCNAKCAFCSYRGIKRNRYPMTDETVDKVVKEVSLWEDPVAIMPYFYGETLMNPKLFDQCELFGKHAPKTRMELSTNGSLLNEEKIENLVNMKNLKFVNFSVYAGTKETYEKLMGLKFNTLDKIEAAIKRFQESRPDVGLCVGCTTDPRFVSAEDLPALQLRFGKYGNIVSPHPISFNSQHVNGFPRTKLDTAPCITVFLGVVVYNDGVIGACCFDVEHELKIGNMTEGSMPIITAYNRDSQGYRFLHATGMKNNIPLCKTCTQPN